MSYETIAEVLSSASPQPQVLLVLAGLFGAVILAVFGLADLGRKDRTGQRMQAARSDGREGRQDVPVATSLREEHQERAWQRVLRPIEKHMDFADADGESGTRLRLLQAGFTHPRAARTYFAVRIVLAFGLALPVLFLAPLISRSLEGNEVAMIALGAGAFGFYLPYRVVQSRLERRQRAISEGFPDALDMMVVCAEAGLGLDATFSRVGQQMATSHPELAAEFAILGMALRAGHTREEALRKLAQRTGVEEVTSFVTLIVQSERLGASIAQTLRVQSADMRQRRMLRAEEKAHKLPVKMVVPLVTCILPAMIVAVLLPGLINIARNILPALG